MILRLLFTEGGYYYIVENNNLSMQVFNDPSFGNIRTLIIDNNIWFIASEVAELLEYSNPQKAVRNHVDVEDKNIRTICSGIRGNPNVNTY